MLRVASAEGAVVDYPVWVASTEETKKSARGSDDAPWELSDRTTFRGSITTSDLVTAIRGVSEAFCDGVKNFAQLVFNTAQNVVAYMPTDDERFARSSESLPVCASGRLPGVGTDPGVAQ